MQGIVLAGGFGTRLQSVVNDVPKPMAKIGEKPFLEWQLDYLAENDVRDIVFLTGYKAEVIENYFSNKEGFRCSFSREEGPLGTAGAIFNCWEKLEDYFFVFNGDSFFDIDLNLLHHFNKQVHGNVIALRYSKDSSRYGIVAINNKFIVTDFIEKGALKDAIDGFINGGIYFFSKAELYKYYDRWDGCYLSLEKDIFPKMAAHGRLFGLPVGGLFIDIGIPEDYAKANEIIPGWFKMQRSPALFLDRDNVLIEDSGYTFGEDIKLLDKVDKYIKAANEAGYPVIVVSNQSGVARGYFTEEDVKITNTSVLNKYRDKGLFINKFIYCPYHIDGNVSGYNVNSYLRKPEPGMLLSACELYKIDMKSSLMIGDNSETDNIRLPYLECKIVF